MVSSGRDGCACSPAACARTQSPEAAREVAPEITREIEMCAEARRWPAHRAAYYDRHAELARLSAGWAEHERPGEWSALDGCGNSIAHVAALRGSVRCLRLAFRSGFVAADARNSAGWTALQEAIAAGDVRTARLIFDLTGEGGEGVEGGEGGKGGMAAWRHGRWRRRGRRRRGRRR